MRSRPSLILFAKEPRPGRVKTRLAREIGPVAAAAWCRRQSARLIRELGRDPRWLTVLAVAPDTAMQSPFWPADLPRFAQGTGDLGRRMARALAAMPPGPAMVVGADVPGLDRIRAADAFAALAANDAVLGPAGDGGFWAVGLSRRGAPVPERLFDGARWSSEHALADTVARLAPRRIGYAATLDDVDTRADLIRLCGKAALR